MITRPAPKPAYRWVAASARWIAPDGRFVPELAPRQALEGLITDTQAQMLLLSRQLQAHTITLAQWQGGIAKLSKRLHVAAALAAGGTGTFTPQQSGRLGAILKRQYQALDSLAADIATGKQKLDGTLLNRTRLYAQAGRSTWEAIRGGAQQIAGQREAKRIRHSADSCPGCISEAARGWVPVAQLAPIGSQQCRSNCLCTVAYR
jgi:hypothetical protein